MVFIEASSAIPSKNWLQNLLSSTTSQTQIIIGNAHPVANPKKPQHFRRYLFLKSQLFARAFSQLGKPYTLSDKSISYTNQLYFKNNGYINHINQHPLAHELFVLQTATPKNTVFSEKEPLIFELPKTSTDWKTFRKKQQTIFSKINFGAKFMHYFLLLSKLALLATVTYGITMSILEENWIYLSVFANCFLIGFLSYWLTIIFYLNTFSEKKLSWRVPFYEVLCFFNRF